MADRPDSSQLLAAIEDRARELRGALGGLRAAAENLDAFPGASPELRQQLVRVILAEGHRIGECIDGLEQLAHRPRAGEHPASAAALLAALESAVGAAGLECRTTAAPAANTGADPDAFRLAAADFLAALRRHAGATWCGLRASVDRDLLVVDLAWRSEHGAEPLGDWQGRALDPDPERSGPGLRELARSLGGEAWCNVERDGDGARLRLVLPLLENG